MAHRGDQPLLRDLNRSAILDHLRKHAPMSRTDLARELNLSQATVSRVVADMIREGLVTEAQVAATSGSGRPPRLLQFNPQAGCAIGVHLDGSHIRGVLTDLDGRILHRQSLTIDPSGSKQAAFEQLLQFLQTLLAEPREQGMHVQAIGIGVPGITHPNEGTVEWAPSLNWRNYPLRDHVAENIDLPIFVENDVNLIALGEFWRGVGHDVDTLVVIYVGSGVGAGLILNGNLYRGAQNAAGEVGYLLPGRKFLGRRYNGFGCLEELVSTRALIRAAQTRAKLQPDSQLHEHLDRADARKLDIHLLLDAARAGDLVATQIVDETVDYLTIALANTISIVAPPIVVLSGELFLAGEDLFLEPIRRRLDGLVPVMPDLCLAELGQDAATVGAAILALNQTEEAVFLRRPGSRLS